MKTAAAKLTSFDTLPLRGATIRSVHIEPLKKVSVRVFTFGEHAEDPHAGNEYELLFAKVAGFRLTSLHLPTRVQAHSLASASSFIDELRTNFSPNSAGIDPLNVQHYQLITDTGQIDVVSEIAVCLPVWEP